MPYRSIRGHDHYIEWVTQRADQPSPPKPVMVFLHGWGGSGRYWRSTAAQLADRVDCLLYDLRGFGRSQLHQSPPSAADASAYPLQSYVEDLVALLDDLQIPQAYLQAHSMGATIATLFSNQYPQRVQGVILTSTGLFTYDPQIFRQFHQVSQWVVRLRPSWLVYIPFIDQLLMGRFLHRSIPPDQRREFVGDYLGAEAGAALGTLRSAVSEAIAIGLRQEFTRLSVPALIISGEQDKIVSAQSGQEAAALNPKIDYVLMTETGHFPMLEDPLVYGQQIRDFLDAVPCCYG
ncbi:MAG: alpha/beta hydrolase [Acaryochloridaceae cyanobacterium SU_2_1]|nr:alpha/beta hydrolase [Acaryochloridaceae cyanobacterium SU_2_1]